MSTCWIAEVSSNHNQNLDRCLRFIDTSAELGCDMVKFQLFTVEKLFHPEALRLAPQLQARRDWELPTAFLPDIKARCVERGILFACTPFYLDAVEELFSYVDVYKIASYELLWLELLRACAQTKKPVILSTGMATLSEVTMAVETLLRAGCRNLTLLHCASAYPAPVVECNLSAIRTMGNRFLLPVGWSDHSASPAVLLRAIHRWQASTIEFHLDLDGTGEEFATGHCWLPAQIAPVIALVRDGYAADGDGIKRPTAGEAADVAWRADPGDGLRPLLATRQAWL